MNRLTRYNTIRDLVESKRNGKAAVSVVVDAKISPTKYDTDEEIKLTQIEDNTSILDEETNVELISPMLKRVEDEAEIEASDHKLKPSARLSQYDGILDPAERRRVKIELEEYRAKNRRAFWLAIPFQPVFPQQVAV
jgi:hypothetical protein